MNKSWHEFLTFVDDKSWRPLQQNFSGHNLWSMANCPSPLNELVNFTFFAPQSVWHPPNQQFHFFKFCSIFYSLTNLWPIQQKTVNWVREHCFPPYPPNTYTSYPSCTLLRYHAPPPPALSTTNSGPSSCSPSCWSPLCWAAIAISRALPPQVPFCQMCAALSTLCQISTRRAGRVRADGCRRTKSRREKRTHSWEEGRTKAWRGTKRMRRGRRRAGRSPVVPSKCKRWGRGHRYEHKIS